MCYNGFVRSARFLPTFPAMCDFCIPVSVPGLARRAVLLTPSLSLRLPRPRWGRRFRSGRDYPTKSLRHNLFDDPHPLNLYPAIFYKNTVARGIHVTSSLHTSLVSSSLSPLDATLMASLARAIIYLTDSRVSGIFGLGVRYEQAKDTPTSHPVLH
jgi:hypothetical protein